ncbi:MAG: glycosyltransferase family 4 protein [Anaerolineales bacterium]
MKIAVIAPTHLPARRANTIQVMKMTQAFVALGHTARLCVPTPPGSPADIPWDELAHHYGLRHHFPVTWLPVYPRLRGYDFAASALRWARAWGADLTYTRLPQTAALSSVTGVPTIYEIHDRPQGMFGPVVFRAFLRGKGAQRLVVITRALADDLRKEFPNFQSFVIIAPDGVDLARYRDLPDPQTARHTLELPSPGTRSAPLPAPRNTRPSLPNRFTAGYTGHLYPGRGAEMLLAIASRLPDVTFLLAGGNPEDVARVREQAASQESENVILTGFVPNTELPRYQAACDILLMPYQKRVAASSGGDIARYLSPMKLFEYLACGRAILSSDLPVLQEVLTPKNAALLPPDDVDAWVSAVRNLQADPEKRAALAAQARGDAEKYAWEARAARVLEG